jgi:hypothetical protein
MTETTKLAASKIEPGMVIRRYAPYKYALDWQAVTEIKVQRSYDGKRVTGLVLVRETDRISIAPHGRVEVKTDGHHPSLCTPRCACKQPEASLTPCTSEHPGYPGLVCHYTGTHPVHYALGYTWEA